MFDFFFFRYVLFGCVLGLDVQIGGGETLLQPAVETEDSERAGEEVKGIWCAGSAQLCRNGSFHFFISSG